MSATNKLLEFRVVKIDCDITEITYGDEITLSVSENISAKKPADPAEKKALLEIETTITSDGLDQFRINLTSQAVFSFQENMESFEDIMQKECYPQAHPHIRKAIKEITGAMHITPLDLGE